MSIFNNDEDYLFTVKGQQYDSRLIKDFHLAEDGDEVTLFFEDGTELTFSKSDDLSASDEALIDQLIDPM